MGFKGLFDVLVQLAVGACCLRRVKIAASENVAITGVEVQGTRHVLDLRKRKKLIEAMR